MDPNEPIRKRIVINLDQQNANAGSQRVRPAPRSGRLWLKVLAVLAVLVLVVVAAAAIGGFFWWRHYQTTPAYTLALIIDAAQRDDMAEFQARIDDEAIARNMIATVSERAAGRYGLAINATLQKQIDVLMPTLLPRLKETIHQEVAKEIKEFASKSEPKPFVVVALAVPTLMTITNDDQTAKASTTINDRTVELSLQRDSDRWKVTEFKDDVLIQRVVDSVMKELPAIGGLDLKLPIFKTPGKKSGRNR
jgi:hypothetical protein